jgi:hypothetical protein
MKLNGSVSLSFLDLLTCCLGAMLLLFFVIVLIRQHSTTGQDAGGIAGGDDSTPASFLVVTADLTAGEPSQAAVWKLKKEGRDLENPAFVFQSSAQRYAIFYATQNLPSGTELWLESGGPKSTYQVSVFAGGDSTESLALSDSSSHPVFIWP